MLKMRLLILLIYLSPWVRCFAVDGDTDQLKVVKKWIAHRSSVTSVSASFVQERHLKALKRPIINTGKLWVKAPRLFRWEVGSPAESIAISKNGTFLMIRPIKKSAEIHSVKGLKNNGRSPVSMFFEAGFPNDYKDFTRRFTVTDITRRDGNFLISLKVNDRRTSLALRKIVFEMNAKTYITESMEIRFRDTSSIKTKFSDVRENEKLSDNLFEFDLTGFHIKDVD